MNGNSVLTFLINGLIFHTHKTLEFECEILYRREKSSSTIQVKNLSFFTKPCFSLVDELKYWFHFRILNSSEVNNWMYNVTFKLQNILENWTAGTENASMSLYLQFIISNKSYISKLP